ncbi:MAG: gliding motility protein GldL [Muribaculaceae bacterium]|nr:gliding motility protein GldL [Muribaculaceae bacterium]
MVKIRKYANFIERFLHGEKGQRFFNFAYSIGAAVVIWGALFKILHLPGGSTLLCIGMGTEIAMFLLTAFDRPPKDYHWEEVFPVLDSHDAADRPEMGGSGGIIVAGGAHNGATDVAAIPAGLAAGANLPAAGGVGIEQEDAASLVTSMKEMTEQMKGVTEQIAQLKQTTDALNKVSEVLLQSYRSITDNSESVSASSSGYVERLEDLNRNIGGLNTIYEIQLKSISSQLESIDRVNRGLKDIRDMYEKSAGEASRYCEETERMSRYMRQLNKIYENMITAMTINMAGPMMGAQQQRPNPFDKPTTTED